jgi:hypothetical protein
MNVRETLAYKDLQNTSEKLLLNMKKIANLDLSLLDDEERTEFQQLLDDANGNCQ